MYLPIGFSKEIPGNSYPSQLTIQDVFSPLASAERFLAILIQDNLPYKMYFPIDFSKEIPGNSYPSQLTIQDVFSNWLQKGDSWQFLYMPTYHTRCLFPYASAGRFLKILIQVNLPYKKYFPIGFSKEIPNNSYPSQQIIQDVFSHWLQQRDTWQFLSKSGYHTRCIFPLVSAGRFLAFFLSKSAYHTGCIFPLALAGRFLAILIQDNLPYKMYFPIGFSREIPSNSYPSQLTIQDVFSHWLQQGDSYQFLSKSPYHTRCIFPLASAGRFLAILIQVNLPYKMYFPIGFSRGIPGNSYPSQLTIQNVFSHWLQQGDSWQFLSKSTYHTRCTFPLASTGRFLTILIQVNFAYKM